MLVLLNDEIHAAREVTKTSTGRMQTFRSPDFGALGHADGDKLAWYRKPLRKVAPDTEFDVRGLAALPRVDVSYTYAGSDGVAIGAFVAAGAKGIVCAGFAPGFVTPDDGGQDVFLHSSVLQRAGRQDVQQGEKVSLDVRDGQRGRQAVSLK